MDELLRSLSSPAWWIGVFIVGIVVSLIANYLKPFIDKQLSKYSKRWKKRVERQREERQQRVIRWRKNEHNNQLREEFYQTRETIIIFSKSILGTFFAGISLLLVTIRVFSTAEDSSLRLAGLIFALFFMVLSFFILFTAVNQGFRSIRRYDDLQESYENPEDDKVSST